MLIRMNYMDQQSIWVIRIVNLYGFFFSKKRHFFRQCFIHTTSIATNQHKERERITTYLEEEELQPGRTMNHQQEEEPEARSSVREEVICLKKRQRKKENEEAEGEGEQRRRKKHKRRKVCDSYGRVNIALFILYR